VSPPVGIIGWQKAETEMEKDPYEGTAIVTKIAIPNSSEKTLVIACTEASGEVHHVILSDTTEHAFSAFRQVTYYDGKLGSYRGVWNGEIGKKCDNMIQIIAHQESPLHGYDNPAAIAYAAMMMTHSQLRELFDFLTDHWT
jgi:hypothetical protein